MRETTREGSHARRLFLVANGSRAKGYRKRLAESGYDPVMEWDEPDARRPDSALGEDKPGRTFPSAGSGQRSAMEFDGIDDSPKEHAKRDLARSIAGDLAAALRAGGIDSVVVVAPPPVARAVIDHLPAEQRAAVAGEDHHDLTGLPMADLFARLDALRHGV
ncbi:host attachment protein [Roseomonas sp. HF4]|uniref:host attachment protein n=1 Tax=Roseomonas sp. HF4 TaxID=2562313 RepID=UPI00198175C6|nr:host attachment protein [Roseomonas sp. HF4]